MAVKIATRGLSIDWLLCNLSKEETLDLVYLERLVSVGKKKEREEEITKFSAGPYILIASVASRNSRDPQGFISSIHRPHGVARMELPQIIRRLP